MEETRIFALIKFGSKKFMSDLFENGTIYLNTLSYFKEVDKNENRSDKHEGIIDIKQVTYIKIIFENDRFIELSLDGSIGGKLNSAQLRQWHADFDGNIYCMYAITSDWPIKNACIDPRNATFGDGEPCMVVIHNTEEFKKRIIAKLEELNLKAIGKMVTYYDENKYEGVLDEFHKSNQFEYQCEFRIFVYYKEGVQYEPNGALCFQIGSMKDIATIHTAENLTEIQVVIED